MSDPALRHAELPRNEHGHAPSLHILERPPSRNRAQRHAVVLGDQGQDVRRHLTLVKCFGLSVRRRSSSFSHELTVSNASVVVETLA